MFVCVHVRDCDVHLLIKELVEGEEDPPSPLDDSRKTLNLSRSARTAWFLC